MKASFALAAFACLALAEAGAAQRVFVASNGLDTNPCTIPAPCRSFAYALDQVDEGGEVVALDAAGYGTAVISKSVTITTNSGFFAGVAAATGSAITIASGDARVILRGLALNGIGAQRGIHMALGATLTIENCVISNFLQAGIYAEGEGNVRILDTVVTDNGGATGDGIVIRSAYAALDNVKMSRNARAGLAISETATVTVSNSDSSFNGYGFLSDGTSDGGGCGCNEPWLTVRRSSASNNSIAGVATLGPGGVVAVGYSQVAGNAVGFLNGGDEGWFESYENNVLRYNDVEVSGTIMVAPLE